MPSLRLLIPQPDPKAQGKILAQINFVDEVMVRDALIGSQPPSESKVSVRLCLQIPIAESPTFTTPYHHNPCASSLTGPSSPWADVKLETGVIAADTEEECIKQNRKLAMGHLTGEILPRVFRLAQAETLEILESKREPNPTYDWDRRAACAPLFKKLRRAERTRPEVALMFEEMYERRQLDRPLTSEGSTLSSGSDLSSLESLCGGDFFKTMLLSTFSPSDKALFSGWSDAHHIMLVHLEPDGPFYERITHICNLKACTMKEYREKMVAVAERGWRDAFIVARSNHDLPRGWRIPRAEPQIVVDWGSGMF